MRKLVLVLVILALCLVSMPTKVVLADPPVVTVVISSPTSASTYGMTCNGTVEISGAFGKVGGYSWGPGWEFSEDNVSWTSSADRYGYWTSSTVGFATDNSGGSFSTTDGDWIFPDAITDYYVRGYYWYNDDEGEQIWYSNVENVTTAHTSSTSSYGPWTVSCSFVSSDETSATFDLSDTIDPSYSGLASIWDVSHGFVFGKVSVPDNPMGLPGSWTETLPEESGYTYYVSDDEEVYPAESKTWEDIVFEVNDGSGTYYCRPWIDLGPVGGDHVYGDEIEFVISEALGDPTDLTVTGSTATTISLEWAIGSGATKTLVMYKDTVFTGESPVEGTEGYFGTENVCTVSGLSKGTTYYFRAWSWIA